MPRCERQGRGCRLPAGTAPRATGSLFHIGPERTRMSQLLAARLSAVAHRGRAVASLVAALALAVALLATAATAGASTHARTGHAAKQAAGHHNPNGAAGDKAPGKDDNDRKAEAGDDGQVEPACGENSGHGSADATCPAGNPQCPAGDEGAGHAQDAKARGREAKGEKAKGAKAKTGRVANEGEGNACEPKPDCVSSGPGNPC